MPVPAPNPAPAPRPRGLTIVAAGLLLVALALVVIYTNRGAFLSPLALVVVAAIGLAALLLQIRLRPDLASSSRGPLWLNLLGVVLALVAVFADSFHFNPAVMLIAALASVISFGVSGIVVLSSLRKRRN
ncbi:MAG: hypothetical protein WAL56_08605 [Candidatus Sulfotelmatobacter sp.]